MTFPEVDSQPASAVNQTRLKRQLADQAIAQATAAQWSDAAETNGRLLMPVAVDVHHALCDGVHVGRFFERFQANLDAI